jgi:S1-C subfamily serine protease
MKAFSKLIFASFIGGAITFGIFKIFDKDTVIYEQSSPTKIDTKSSSAGIADLSVNFVNAAEKANPAVVHIKAKNKAFVDYESGNRYYDPFEDFWGYRRNQKQPQAGAGSGVIISPDGYIVTNNHVVAFADFIEVVTQDGRSFEGKRIGTDPSTDLALVKIESQRLPYLNFANSDNVKVGEWVMAVGNPFNLTSTVTAGIVSAKGRELDIIQNQKSIEEFIQTDAVVNPGNSGGALVNTNGDLIGINTAISSPTGVYAGYSFAIPSNLVEKVVNEIKETGGDIERGMLGIQITDASYAQSQGYKVGINYGVYVAEFNVDRYGRTGFSSAQSAGIEKGDVIIAVDGKDIKDSKDLSSALKFVKIGDTVGVTVYRNGNKKLIPVKLKRGI